MKSVGAHWIFISYLIIPIAINAVEAIYRSSLRPEDKTTESSQKSDLHLTENHRIKLSPEKNGVNGLNGVVQNGKTNKLE